MPSNTSPPSSDQQDQVTGELLLACFTVVELARRTIALLNLPASSADVLKVEDLLELTRELSSAIELRYVGDRLDEPSTPKRYRFAAGR